MTKENENDNNNNLTTLNLTDSGIQLLKPDEEFRQLPMGKRYYISNYGRLIHIKKNGEIKLVNPHEARNGYLNYSIGTKKSDGKYVKRCYQAHDLVGLMFVPCQYSEKDIDNIDKLEIHHKDHNIQNNDARNLMWTSTPDHGLIHTIRGVGLFDWDKMDIIWFDGQEDWLAYELDITIPQLMQKLRAARETDPEGYSFNVGGNNVFIAFKPRKSKGKKKQQAIEVTPNGGDNGDDTVGGDSNDN